MYPQRTLAPLWGLAALIALGLAAAPRAQAQATQQTLYVSNQGSGAILTFNNGTSSVFDDNTKQPGTFNNPGGLAFGSDGNLYLANTNAFNIVKFDSAGNGTVFASVNSPEALAFDSAGSLYASSGNGNSIQKFTFTNGTLSMTSAQFGPAIGSPTGIAFNGGNLYVGDGQDSYIQEITPGGVGSTFANTNDNSGPNMGVAGGLAFDKAGNLYIAKSTNTIEKITPDGVKSVFNQSFTSGDLSDPRGLVFDDAGNLYVANHGDSTIEMFNSAGVGSLFADSSNELNQPTGLTFGPVIAPVPEPSQLAFFSLGILGLSGLVLRARRRKAVGV